MDIITPIKTGASIKNICDKDKSEKENKAFQFTNENVRSFENLYPFDNAIVWSVLGSGDQCLSAKLYGAKKVEVYDTNDDAWDLFVLKWYGICTLSYEDFYNYFVNKRLNSQYYFEKLLRYLPIDVANSLKRKYHRYLGLSHLLYADNEQHKFNDGRVIPYLDRKNYYLLQSILLKSELPKFHSTCLSKLPEEAKGESIDILLASNIYAWLPLAQDPNGVEKYKEILKRFNCPEIQADYRWILPKYIEQEFEKNDFVIDEVPSAKVLKKTPDTVISLRRH